MTILFGIIAFHLLVIFRAKQTINEKDPIITIFLLTAVMVAFAIAMMYNMQPPE